MLKLAEQEKQVHRFLLFYFLIVCVGIYSFIDVKQKMVTKQKTQKRWMGSGLEKVEEVKRTGAKIKWSKKNECNLFNYTMNRDNPHIQ